MGIAAVVIWGSLFSVARSVIEQFGMLWSMSIANLLAGFIGLGIAAARPTGFRRVFSLSRAYLVVCGLLFVVYNVAVYLALQLAGSHDQVIEVSLINYLWPAITVVLMVPILGKRARITLLPSLAVALAGIYLGMRAGRNVSLAMLCDHLRTHPLPYILALLAALSWGFYSNLARRWAGDGGAVPLFLLVTGAALAIAAVAGEPFPSRPLTIRATIEMLYFTLCPTLLAYTLWDAGMRKGNIVPISSVSFFAPLISVLISCFYLHVPMSLKLAGACGLVIVGAVACKWSIIEPPQNPAA